MSTFVFSELSKSKYQWSTTWISVSCIDCIHWIKIINVLPPFSVICFWGKAVMICFLKIKVYANITIWNVSFNSCSNSLNGLLLFKNNIFKVQGGRFSN